MARDRSRDEAAFGAEVLRAFGGLNVLIVGDLKAFGTELAKNVILTGPRSVTLHDSALVAANDLGLNVSYGPASLDPGYPYLSPNNSLVHKDSLAHRTKCRFRSLLPY